MGKGGEANYTASIICTALLIIIPSIGFLSAFPPPAPFVATNGTGSDTPAPPNWFANTTVMQEDCDTKKNDCPSFVQKYTLSFQLGKRWTWTDDKPLISNTILKRGPLGIQYEVLAPTEPANQRGHDYVWIAKMRGFGTIWTAQVKNYGDRVSVYVDSGNYIFNWISNLLPAGAFIGTTTNYTYRGVSYERNVKFWGPAQPQPTILDTWTDRLGNTWTQVTDRVTRTWNGLFTPSNVTMSNATMSPSPVPSNSTLGESWTDRLGQRWDVFTDSVGNTWVRATSGISSGWERLTNATQTAWSNFRNSTGLR